VVPQCDRCRPLRRERPPHHPEPVQGTRGYTPEATIAKIRQSEANASADPPAALDAYHSSVGDSLCVGCPFQGKVLRPHSGGAVQGPCTGAGGRAAGRHRSYHDRNSPIPPAPFVRLKDGGIAVLAKDAAGNEGYQTIYDYDLYPIRRLSNPILGIEQHIWHVELPRARRRISRSTLTCFTTAASSPSLFRTKAYILTRGTSRTCRSIWSPTSTSCRSSSALMHSAITSGGRTNYDQFILPDKILCADGTAKRLNYRSVRSAHQPAS
jgi:hypothetical protein